MECTPAVSIEVLNVTTPPANVPMPRTVVPSVNVTVPVAVDETVDETTVAEKVTASPYVDVGNDESTLVVVEALSTIRAPEAELAPKFPCAAYAAFKV